MADQPASMRAIDGTAGAAYSLTARALHWITAAS